VAFHDLTAAVFHRLWNATEGVPYSGTARRAFPTERYLRDSTLVPDFSPLLFSETSQAKSGDSREMFPLFLILFDGGNGKQRVPGRGKSFCRKKIRYVSSFCGKPEQSYDREQVGNKRWPVGSEVSAAGLTQWERGSSAFRVQVLLGKRGMRTQFKMPRNNGGSRGSDMQRGALVFSRIYIRTGGGFQDRVLASPLSQTRQTRNEQPRGWPR
jgi:hypothetical protein